MGFLPNMATCSSTCLTCSMLQGSQAWFASYFSVDAATSGTDWTKLGEACMVSAFFKLHLNIVLLMLLALIEAGLVRVHDVNASRTSNPMLCWPAGHPVQQL
jgi:hypothetical protein